MNHPQPVLEALRRPMPEALGTALAARFGDRYSAAQAVRDGTGPRPPKKVPYGSSLR